ncbi:10664_t:CDS:2 [Racocetra fulgida]|uniref:10664_t:CDS:1 n=1 Tax=Racocetra fulgida TaxID=60492 RepID=A0A9N9FIB0_9GLOM|nr:10664_t:CDS:2 [Racocetra fulgida]
MSESAKIDPVVFTALKKLRSSNKFKLAALTNNFLMPTDDLKEIELLGGTIPQELKGLFDEFFESSVIGLSTMSVTVTLPEENNNENEEYDKHCLLFPTYATKHGLDNEEFMVRVIGITNSDKMAIESDPKGPEEDPKKILDNVNEKIKDKIEEQHKHPDDKNPFAIFKPHTGNVNGNISIQQAIVNEWIGGKPTGNDRKSLIEGVFGIFGKGQQKEEQKEQPKGEKIKLLKLEAHQHQIVNPLLKQTYGVVNLIEPDGYSVISDIDDTIKQTEILEGARTVFSNTFLQKAKENPDRILRIFVRDVTTEHVKNQPAQSPHQSYVQTFTSTYKYIKDYYLSSEGKEEDPDKEHEQENDEPEQENDEPKHENDEPKHEDEHDPHKPKRQQSLSNRLMKKLHTEMSSIYSSISSNVQPEHQHDLPSDVDIDSHDKPVEKQEMKTPLEMFHERLDNLKKGIPDGVFSTFLDPSEIENDPIIKNALKY